MRSETTCFILHVIFNMRSSIPSRHHHHQSHASHIVWYRHNSITQAKIANVRKLRWHTQRDAFICKEVLNVCQPMTSINLDVNQTQWSEHGWQSIAITFGAQRNLNIPLISICNGKYELNWYSCGIFFEPYDSCEQRKYHNRIWNLCEMQFELESVDLTRFLCCVQVFFVFVFRG